MSLSLNLTDAQAFQAYAEEHSAELYSQIFLGNKTSQIVTVHEGVKGNKTLTELELGTLFKRFNVQPAVTADTVKLIPRTLETIQASADVDIAPTEFEQTYFGYLRQTGQNPQDFPFQAYVMMKIIEKYAQEIEIAQWQGVKTGAPAATDPLTSLFDGYLEKIADAITALDLTAYVSGALTNANILGHIETMAQQLSANFQSGKVHVYLSQSNMIKLKQNYRNDIGKYTDPDQHGAFRLDFLDVDCYAIPGMQSSNRLIVTTASNLQYGFDGPMDASMINMQWLKRVLQMWSDIRIGVEFLWLTDASGAIVVNDQT